MALLTTDLFVVERDGTQFKMSSSQIADFAGAVNLGYIAALTQGTVTNDAGDDVVLPAVTALAAGLATPDMLNNSHAPATSDLSTDTNPINISAGQVVGFSIAQLADLP